MVGPGGTINKQNALVIGVEYISPFMDWSNRNVAVLFGDGAGAVVVSITLVAIIWAMAFFHWWTVPR